MSQETQSTSSRWLRLYNAAAAITFNTLLLLIISLVVVSLLAPPADESAVLGPSGMNAVYSQWFRLHTYRFVDEVEAQATVLEYDDWAANGHWQVHPWTGLISREFDGRYLNINADGVRQSRQPDAAYAEQPPLRVWLFGGSTLFGWGLGDDWTIPSQVQTALQAELPDYQVQVTNYGAPIYNSSQELALFTANLRLQPPPHAVVFMDGVNDVWFTVYAATQTSMINPLSAAWESQVNLLAGQQNAPWITVNDTFPAARWAQQTLNRPASQGSNMMNTGANYSLQFEYEGSRDERLERIIATYRHNRRMATAIADEYAILPLFTLQPWRDDNYVAFREGVLAGNTPHTVDISDLFDATDSLDNPYMVDDIHYSDYGSQIIANRLAALLIERNVVSYATNEEA